MKAYTPDELQFLLEHYPQKGKHWCAQQLGRTEASIRGKAALLGLKQDRNSAFFKDWQKRAALGKVGRHHSVATRRKMRAIAKAIPRNYTPEQKQAFGSLIKHTFTTKGHPRGMLGKTHTAANRAAMSKRSKALHADPNSKFNTPVHRQALSDRMSKVMRHRLQTKGTVYSRANNGWYEIAGTRYFFRSSWEVVYARYLQFLLEKGKIQKWEHEPDTFWFEKIKRGVRSYLPDFKVTDARGVAYHEVKGWMDPKSVTKIKRMALYYPEVKLIVIQKAEYKPIADFERLYPEATPIPK